MKKSKWLLVYIVVGVIAIISASFMPMLLCTQEEQPKREEPSDAAVDIMIETDYCSLHYPNEWRDYLRTERTENGIAFYADIAETKKVHIFNVLFGSDEGKIADIYMDDGSVIAAAVEFFDIEYDESWSEEEINTVNAMKDDANYLINTLLSSDAVKNKAIEGTTSIETPYGELCYPKKWEDSMRTEITEGDIYSVKFYGKIKEDAEVYLFALTFGDEDGNAVITLDDPSWGKLVHVCVEVAEIESEQWTEEELDTIYAMQESMNDIINELETNI